MQVRQYSYLHHCLGVQVLLGDAASSKTVVAGVGGEFFDTPIVVTD